jgi:HEAT repeat protein
MRCYRGFSALGFLALFASRGLGYPITPAPSLDTLGEQSDLVAKVQAVGSEIVVDSAFPEAQGYKVFATRFKVISVLKGAATPTDITFHHYDDDPTYRGGAEYTPTVHHFVVGQSYVLFAKKSDAPAAFRSFSISPTMAPEKETVRTADATPLPKGIAIRDAVWLELQALLASKDAADIAYGIHQLENFSTSRFWRRAAKEDFPRKEVLALISPFLADQNPAVAGAALEAIGCESPYLSENEGWLATVGKGEMLRRGYATYPVGYDNPSARACRAQLVALANSRASTVLRSQAIRALGLSRENERDNALIVPLRVWSVDAEGSVRAAAAVLWADYPSKEATATIQSLAQDKDPLVRGGAAYGIGCGQVSELLGSLDAMLSDSDQHVSDAAVISLLSFDAKTVAPILKEHLRDARYRVFFINALADANPAVYRDDLAAILTDRKPGPETSLTGQIPSYTAWDILMTHISTCDVGDIRAGRFDKYLDALETPPNIGSRPFQTLYQFYHDNGLTDRMQSFRAKALKQETSYDLDYYFKQIDGRP